MAPVPAWTREWRPLARQLCAHISGNNQNHEEEQSSFSKEALFLRADRVVGQLYSHRFVDTLPQDVHAQAQALATKFRVHSLEERADKLLQLAPQCEYQVLKLLLELATSPTTATDQEVAVDQDTKSRWNTVLQQQQLKIQQEKLMQDQLVEELFQISTNDEWYQAWEDSDEDESDWDMNSADGSAVESERSVNAGHRNAKRPTEALEDEKLMPFTLDRPWLLCEAVETVVRMIFEALHGVDSLLFEFHPVRPSPSIFSFDFQTKMVKRSRDSFNVAVGHLSPLALQHILDTFTQAATELQTLRDFVGFIRRVRDLSVQHRCVTLEGLAHALSDSTPWSGITPRQPTLLGIYGGLKETFKMISWLKGILMECFSGLSDRHWHEVKRAEQAKCVLDSLYRIMEVEYVEGITADEAARNSGRLARCDVLLHLFTGALSPYLDLINRMVFERGHFETIPLDGELFFASTSAGASPVRESRRNRSFREGLMLLAPFQVNRSLVPTFLESTIPLMDEALASRQLKNRFLQQHTELETMGCCLSSQQVLVECVPFNRILERCLTIHLEEKCRKLNGEITDIFRDKLNYLGHVEALRMFVLMEQQDVFNVFSERLIAHMQENPIAWADSEVINSFHQSAVQGVFEDNSLSSSQRQIGGRLSVGVDFNLLDSATSSARIDIATLKCMHFTFAAQQPLRVFFSASIMQKYSRLGVFLVQVKSVESALVKVRGLRCVIEYAGVTD
ncbi:uncharacterized protein PITG_14022 [Phytophthora infestans T30-4]|uniref:Spindle pole body component n=1 Tax=Phytophthora infestans (strain T30-4) TaxID=403677 RepID=D0NNC4_PHYIT|nr:uncharacterized protein PITG_14022 [Phytophthora infestans T30-4]EEY62031.1 conserved hypothetical protein [Phytophthora infestans T30-4]|eukprot:XP_002899671.1 conserved hypothetical protein [Phytophthora infestans T30-4]